MSFANSTVIRAMQSTSQEREENLQVILSSFGRPGVTQGGLNEQKGGSAWRFAQSVATGLAGFAAPGSTGATLLQGLGNAAGYVAQNPGVGMAISDAASGVQRTACDWKYGACRKAPSKAISAPPRVGGAPTTLSRGRPTAASNDALVISNPRAQRGPIGMSTHTDKATLRAINSAANTAPAAAAARTAAAHKVTFQSKGKPVSFTARRSQGGKRKKASTKKKKKKKAPSKKKQGTKRKRSQKGGGAVDVDAHIARLKQMYF